MVPTETYCFTSFDINLQKDTTSSLDIVDSPEHIDFFKKVVQKHARYASTIPPFNPTNIDSFLDVAKSCVKFESIKPESSIVSPYVRDFTGAFNFYYPHQWATKLLDRAADNLKEPLQLEHLPATLRDLCEGCKDYMLRYEYAPDNKGVPHIIYRPVSVLPDLDHMMMHVPLTHHISVNFSDFINVKNEAQSQNTN